MKVSSKKKLIYTWFFFCGRRCLARSPSRHDWINLGLMDGSCNSRLLRIWKCIVCASADTSLSALCVNQSASFPRYTANKKKKKFSLSISRCLSNYRLFVSTSHTDRVVKHTLAKLKEIYCGKKEILVTKEYTIYGIVLIKYFRKKWTRSNTQIFRHISRLGERPVQGRQWPIPKGILKPL